MQRGRSGSKRSDGGGINVNSSIGPSSAASGQAPAATVAVLSEVLPKAGLVYSKKSNLSEVLCKPKIMPLKSMTLEKLEQLEKQALALRQGGDD